jgi:glycogen(starch) synthase
MKMLFVSNLYPPHHLGGYEMLCHEVATQFAARGHAVTVLTSTFGVSGEQEEAGIFRRLRLESDVYYYRPQRALSFWRDKQANLRAVQEAVVKAKPDVTVIWGMWKLSCQIAAEVERLVGSKVVYYFANEWPVEPSAHEAYWDGSDGSLLGRTFKRVLRVPVRWALRQEWRPCSLRFEHPIACSKSVRDHLVKAGVPVQHAEIIYHGIDPMPYRQAALRCGPTKSNGTLKVVFVGSLVPQKGVHTAIEAMGRLVQSGVGHPVSLDILGAGHPEYEQRLHQLAQEWQVADRVSFHKPIDRSQLPDFLARFDALVLPSIWEEPQARISQEAMAAGLALVATPTGGTKEILVDGQNGLAFEPDNAQALADRLKDLAKDAALRQRLTQRGWETVSEGFTISRMINRVEAYLTKVSAG